MKAARAGKKTLVDSARNVVRTVNRNVYNTLFKSKPTKGRGVRGKAPSAPSLPQTQESKAAKAKAAALKKKAAAESAASKKRLAAIRAGKNPSTPMTSRAASKSAPKSAPKKAPVKKAPPKTKPTTAIKSMAAKAAAESAASKKRLARIRAATSKVKPTTTSQVKPPAPKLPPAPRSKARPSVTAAKARPSAPKSTPKSSSLSAQNKEYDRLRKAGKTKEAEALGKKIAAEARKKAPKNPFRAPQGSERKDATYRTVQALRAARQRFDRGEQTNPERGRSFNDPMSADKRNKDRRNNGIA